MKVDRKFRKGRYQRKRALSSMALQVFGEDLQYRIDTMLL